MRTQVCPMMHTQVCPVPVLWTWAECPSCFPFTWQRVEGEDVSLKPWWLLIRGCSWVDTNEEFKPNLVVFVQNLGLEIPYIYTIVTAISFWVIILLTSPLFFLLSRFFIPLSFESPLQALCLRTRDYLQSIPWILKPTNDPLFIVISEVGVWRIWPNCQAASSHHLNTSLPICVGSSLVLKQVIKRASQYNRLLAMTFCACAFANIGQTAKRSALFPPECFLVAGVVSLIFITSVVPRRHIGFQLI